MRQRIVKLLVLLPLAWSSLLLNPEEARAAPGGQRAPIAAIEGTVTIAGHVALRFRTALSGAPPDQRADIVAGRLQERLAWGSDPRAIAARKDGRLAILYWGDAPLLVVTREEARAQHSSPDSLAGLWAHRLRELLAAPVLTVSRKHVVIPLGETRELTFGGLLRAPTGVSGTGDVVAASLDVSGRRAVLRGRGRGDARLLFSREGVTLGVTVAVRPYAGRLPGSAEAFVSGSPAPRALIERRAVAVVRPALALEPGAAVEVHTPPGALALRAGHTIRLRVPVRIRAPECLPVEGQVPVTVRNLRLDHPHAPQLLYSNDPEQVTQYGTLFLGSLSPEQPARVLYHHQNALGRRFRLSVDVVNPGPDAVRLHVVEGTAAPSGDPIAVGHQAAREFLQSHRRGIGYVAPLAPGTALSLALHALAPWHVASGLLEIRQLDGEAPCYVQVKADDPDDPFVRPTVDGGTLSPTIFAQAWRPVEAEYRVGERWAFVRLGSRPQNGASRLTEEGFGDYGVTYDIALRLENPTQSAGKVGVVMDAASGKARGLFLLDGRLVETPTLSSHEEIVLAVYNLPPGGTRRVSISTLPLSGSAYPVRLVVRELPDRDSVRPGSLLRAH
ncbi:MAG: hypothetical protein HY321_21610 [Armatimonadetes bacterium]|nr:hypothetical protein [Armatimonadota bacterium]